MTETEEKNIDSKVEQMMDWAKTREAEAEQLALDSARLMACTTDRLDRLTKQGFFKHCWSRFNGDASALEKANVNDVLQMQKAAFRYVNMLQEQQLLMAHSLLSLKNNLNSLAVKEEETRNLIAMLAQRTKERFDQLESRVDKIEISTNLQGWLLGLEERDYDEKIPTEYMRLFRVINDFYNIKKDDWNINDLMFMRKAIRTVGLDPKQKISLNTFIDKLTDEIQSDGVGFDAYGQAITMFAPPNIDHFSTFAIDNISSPVFATIHGLKTQYMDKIDAVEALQDSLSIPANEALKILLRQSIKGMNVNLDYEFPLAETAIEILGCLRLSDKLSVPNIKNENIEIPSKLEINEQQSKILKGNEASEYLINFVENWNLNDCDLESSSTNIIYKNNTLIDETEKIFIHNGFAINLFRNIEMLIKHNNKYLLWTNDKRIITYDNSKNIFSESQIDFIPRSLLESFTDKIEKLALSQHPELFEESDDDNIQLLEGSSGVELFFDIANNILRSDIIFDKNKTFAKIDGNKYGTIPEEINKICKVFENTVQLDS